MLTDTDHELLRTMKDALAPFALLTERDTLLILSRGFVFRLQPAQLQKIQAALALLREGGA